MIIYGDLTRMLNNHSNGMRNISLSMAIVSDETTYLFYDRKEFTEQVPNLIYEIGSVTKTFTASLLQKIISEGKVSLTDTIDQFIPEVDWSVGIDLPTIQQLVTHTSGIGNDIDCATEEARKDLEKRLAEFSGDLKMNVFTGIWMKKII